MRWCWVLECGDNLLADYPPNRETHAYCPGCQFEVAIVDSYAHRDDDLMEYVPDEVKA